MNSYRLKTPRIALVALAAVLATGTFALLVLAPAASAPYRHPDAAWGATSGAATGGGGAGTVSVLNVVGVREAHRVTVTAAGAAGAIAAEAPRVGRPVRNPCYLMSGNEVAMS